MCLTPKNQSQISQFSLRSRKGKTGQWARISYSTEYFASLLQTGQVKGAPAASNSVAKTWIRAEFIPDAISNPSVNHSTPHTYPGSVIGLLNSMEPISRSSSRHSTDHLTAPNPSDVSASLGLPVAGPSSPRKRKEPPIASSSTPRLKTAKRLNTSGRPDSESEIIVISD